MGWINVYVRGRTRDGNHKTVRPDREERTVVYTKEYPMTPDFDTRTNVNFDALERGDPNDGIGWGRAYSYNSSFDESYRNNIRGQGVQFNRPTTTGRQVWQVRRPMGTRRTLLRSDDGFQIRVFAAISGSSIP